MITILLLACNSADEFPADLADTGSAPVDTGGDTDTDTDTIGDTAIDTDDSGTTIDDTGTVPAVEVYEWTCLDESHWETYNYPFGVHVEPGDEVELRLWTYYLAEYVEDAYDELGYDVAAITVTDSVGLDENGGVLGPCVWEQAGAEWRSGVFITERLVLEVRR